MATIPLCFNNGSSLSVLGWSMEISVFRKFGRMWRKAPAKHSQAETELSATRQRTLALAHAGILASYPNFSKDKTVVESVLQYEALVDQFQELNGTTYPHELKTATLMRCSDQRLREHLQLTIKEDTKYKDIRETLISHEKATQTWSQEAVLKSVQAPKNDPNGPAPMEVDRIEDKGKGKYKGKGKHKGKYKGWIPFSPYGRGRGGRNGRGKGKGKQKGKSKGKGKNKGKGGKSYGKAAENQCKECFQFGHWARDCPNKVSQVVNQQQPVTVGNASSGGTQSVNPASSTASTVRRILQIGMPSLSSSPSSASSYARMISNGNFGCGQFGEGELVIVDSGSDVSLLPLHLGGVYPSGAEDSKLQDGQGGKLEVYGNRTASLAVKSSEGDEDELQHDFLVADVRSCIMSLGQLYRCGWSVLPGEQPLLQSPDTTLEVPFQYQRNSFAIRAHAFRVEEGDDEDQQNEHYSLNVRAVMKVYESYLPEIPLRQWDTYDGRPFMKCLGSRFLDPKPVWSSSFAFRATLIARQGDSDGTWCVCEVNRNYLEMDDAFGQIPEISTFGQNADCLILTILSREEESLSVFGRLLDEGGKKVQAVPEDAETEGEFPYSPDVLMETAIEADIGEGRDFPEFEEVGPQLQPAERDDYIVVGETSVTPYSSVADLRAVAKFLKVSASVPSRRSTIVFEKPIQKLRG